MPKPQKQTDIPETSSDYKALVDLLSVLTEATNQMAELKLTADNALLETFDDLRPDFARLQQTITDTESALKDIALRNPAWFAERRTIKTPYGEISIRRSCALEIPNEEATIIKIRLEAQKLYPGKDPASVAERAEFTAKYIRLVEEIDKEALEKTNDIFLDLIGVKRNPKENFSCKPASVDLGRAVAAPAQEKEAA